MAAGTTATTEVPAKHEGGGFPPFNGPDGEHVKRDSERGQKPGMKV